MTERPYVLMSCATSVDGYIDDATSSRLLLSDEADFDRVDAVRASCDAILVGANTIRADDPRLVIRSAQHRADRVAQGRSASPLKATITRSGELDPQARFFTVGDAMKLVYGAAPCVDEARRRLGEVATVLDAGDPVDLQRVLADLAARGVGRLMVEGGGQIYTWFLSAGLVDELHLVVAPFFVGDPKAPRFVEPVSFPRTPTNPMRLDEVRQLGDLALLVYRLESHAGD